MSSNFNEPQTKELARYIWDGYCKNLERFNLLYSEKPSLVLNTNSKEKFINNFSNRYLYDIDPQILF